MVITSRWPYVLAGAIPRRFGDPILVDETLSQMGSGAFSPVTQWASAFTLQMRSAAIHATLYPEEARRLGAAHSVVQGDGDVVWPLVLADCVSI